MDALLPEMKASLTINFQVWLLRVIGLCLFVIAHFFFIVFNQFKNQFFFQICMYTVRLKIDSVQVLFRLFLEWILQKKAGHFMMFTQRTILN